MAASVTLEAVLAQVVRGRVAYLVLSPEQKAALRDRDGQTALDVLRHLLGARDAVRAPERFPLTEQAFQAIALRLGYVLGQKRCRALIRRLRTHRIVNGAGSYRQPYRNTPAPSGFRVALHRLARRACGFAKRKRPVGSRKRVKDSDRVPWWQHELFGDLLGRPPPEITPARAARMRSLDELFLSPR
ncbi:MAG TPA: hypothetical protein VGJ58_06325 [Gaiellaceae bacterium]